MSTIAVSSLFVAESAAKILEAGLAVARLLGLPVTSWRTGDPTRSLYKYLAEVLASLEGVYAEYVKAGFLPSATGDWLTVLAREVYGVDRVEATFATPKVTLTNGGGGYYPIEVGDITLQSSASGKTFRNTTAGVLSAGATVTFDFEADEAGSDSAVAVDEIDTMVTTLLGVVIDSSTAATAQDEQSDEALRTQCESTLGALSPNGPADAYEYVVRNPELTGVSGITRATTVDDSDTGDVIVYVAGSSGPVSGALVSAAQDAVETWATPLCVTPTVESAAALAVNVTATITGVDIPVDFEATIEDALSTALADYAVGAGIARSKIIALIHETIPQVEAVVLTVPAADITPAANEAMVAGTVDITEI